MSGGGGKAKRIALTQHSFRRYYQLNKHLTCQIFVFFSHFEFGKLEQ